MNKAFVPGLEDYKASQVQGLHDRIKELEDSLAKALSERDEYRERAKHSQRDNEAMDIIHRAAELLRQDQRSE